MKELLARTTPVRIRLLVGACLIGLLLAVTLGVAVAQTSENFDLGINSLVGGNGNGVHMQSESFQLLTATGPLSQVASTSATYRLCSGLICQVGDLFYNVNAPLLRADPTP